jgi:cullin 1
MCTQKTPYNWSEQLYIRHGETIANYLQNKVLQSLKSKSDELLLDEFVKRGENHQLMNKWCTKFFIYLDRYHVKYQQLPTLAEAGMKKYKQFIFDAVKRDVTNSMLRFIKEEREGNVINRDLIKRCIDIYVKMGMGNVDTYETDFEQPFLEATREFYGAKADGWIVSDSTPSYLLKIEKILNDEKSRVSNYLVFTTESKLTATLEKETLEKRELDLLDKETSGLRVMLINDMLEDLSRLFKLFSRINNGLDPIAEIFKQHILNIGNEKIDAYVARCDSESTTTTTTSAAPKGPPGKKPAAGGEEKEDKEKEGAGASEKDDPQFIKDLLEVHSKFVKMVNDQFGNNPLFQKALKDAFVELVNKDTGKQKTTDLIASFCDRLLKSGSSEKLNDTEIEEFLEKTVELFSYLSDKDAFAEIYRHQLAKRLINQKSASDEMERLMITKLKLRCGAQYTAKFEGMMNDLAIGAEQSTAFAAFCAENPDKAGIGKLDFSVQVLTTGHWPQYKTINEINLPPIMQRSTQVFRDYYDAKTNHRRLAWTHSLGSVLVRGNFKKPIDIEGTTLQAVVLLTFNGDSLGGTVPTGVIPFKALQEYLNMPEDILKKVLHSLSCGKFKVLKKTSEGGEDNKGLKITDSFSFNESFT